MGISSRDLRREQRLAVRMLRAVPHADAADVVMAVDAHPGHISEMLAGLTPRGDCAKTAAAAATKRPLQAHAAAALIHPACPPHVLRDMPTGERHIKMDRAVAYRGGTASWAARRAGDNPTPHLLRKLAGHADPHAIDPAGHPECPTVVLEHLAGSGSSQDRVTVAKTVRSAGLLARLATHPDSGTKWGVAENPHSPALVLETLARDGSVYTRQMVAVHPNRTPETLRSLARDSDPQVRKLVAANSVSDPETLRMLASDSDDDVREALAQNPACAADALGVLVDTLTQSSRFGSRNKQMTLQKVCENPACDAETLIRIADAADGPGSDVAKTIAERADCPPQALEAIGLRHYSHQARAAVAANPNCPDELINRMQQDRRAEVRVAFAGRASWSHSMLEGLCADPKEAVRAALVRNPECPERILGRLAADPDTTVRATVAGHPGCPPEILEHLGSDPSRDVRKAVAANPAATSEILAEITDASVLYVDEQESWIRAAAARNPNCEPGLLRDLAGRIDPNVRAGVAMNPNCPPDVIERLAQDINVQVRIDVARGPRCGPATREKLTQDPDPDVQAIAALRSLPGPNLERLASNPAHRTCAALARNTNCPPGLLLRLADATNPDVSEAVANNPNSPTAARLWLGTEFPAALQDTETRPRRIP